MPRYPRVRSQADVVDGFGSYAGKSSTAAREFANASRQYVDSAFIRQRAQFQAPAAAATATFTFSGLPAVGNYSTGVLYKLICSARDNVSGQRKCAEVYFLVNREGGAASVTWGTLTNFIGADWAIGAVYMNLAATCSTDGSTVTITVVNGGNQRSIILQLGYFAPALTLDDTYIAWGDSLTLGGATTYPGVLSGLLKRRMTNGGVAGETSAQIAARSGGIPTAIAASFTIPATGSVACSTTTGIPTVNGSAIAATIAGVNGSLSYSGGGQLFTRTAAGMATTVPVGTVVALDTSDVYAYNTQLIWAGRNDTVPRVATTLANIASIVGMSTTGKAVVLSVLNMSTEIMGTAGYNDIIAINAALSTTFGAQYLDVRSYLASAQALTDAGLTATGQDTTDIANGVIPTQLRIDSLHLTAAGYTLVASQVQTKLTALGY